DSKVTMLGKAYLARCRRDLGNVFKFMGNQGSGNKTAQEQTVHYAHSTLRGSGAVCARARDISFHGCSTAYKNALESFYRAA
ncbi:MAG: hypothetical protein RSH52_28445, partial [Janthinobacterium sp.]